MTEGMPIPDADAEFTFHDIPRLIDLLPSTGGVPGITYAQICVQNLRQAQDDGWKRIQGAKVYSIWGDLGKADMELLARGKVVLGQSPDAGARRCFIDPEVYTLTGIDNPKTPTPVEGRPETKGAKSGGPRKTESQVSQEA